jgi:hypothetical protein
MKIVRKIVTVSMLLIVSGMVLTGCGKNSVKSPENTVTETPGNETGNTSENKPTDTADNTSDETQTDTTDDISKDNSKDDTTDDSEEVIKEGTVVKDGNVVLKQLAFLYKENTIAISDIVDDKKLESLLGKPEKIKSHTYSPDDGLNMDPLNGMTEKQYQYKGLVIKTIDGAEDKQSFIFSIEITDKKYPTVRNIKVGDSYDKLKEAYPEGNLTGGELTNEEDDFHYEPVNYVDAMNFHIKDKKVESISIYTLLD